MKPTSPNDGVELVLQPPAPPIAPDETGLPPGFSAERVKRLFSSRAVLADPPEAEGLVQDPARPSDMEGREASRKPS